MSVRMVIARVLVPGVLVLAQIDTNSAADRDEQPRLAPPDGWVPGVDVDEVRAGVWGRGDAASGNPETTTTSRDHECASASDGGVLPVPGGILSGDTYLAEDDFDGSYYPEDCGYSYGPSGNDEIWRFEVETDGRWTFDTCTIPAGWDTSLGITSYTGDLCPGDGVACNGDDPCGSYYESAIRDVCLQAGQRYWLIVDGWSPASYFPGTYYDVTYSRTVDPCTDNADCADGHICNGLELCVDGCCVVGPPACEPWEDCDPETQTCFNRYDPCVAWATDETLTGSFSPQCYNGCPGSLIADDIQLHLGSGHQLISYQVYTQARNVMGALGGQCTTDEPLGSPYDITTTLLTTLGWGKCIPDEEIPGTRCDLTEVGVVMESGAPADVSVCEPNGGLPTGIVLPTADEDNLSGQCGVDFYLGLISHNSGAGASLTWGVEQFLGGPALDDDVGMSIMVAENCDIPGDAGEPDGTWYSLCGFGPPCPGDMRGVIVCTVPVGPCCFPAGGCEMLSEFDCPAQGGTLVGLTDPSNPLSCEDDDADPDGDGVYFSCDNCPGLANPQQADCNDDGQGDPCETSHGEQDDDNDGACNDVDPCPTDPNKFVPGTGLGQAPGQCGCGNPDSDRDGDGTADCIDECPNDPHRIVPGVCGCDRPLEVYEDDDNDGFLNCIDTCPNIDDAVYGPCDPDGIPTLSAWGLFTLALSLLVAGKVYFGRRRSADHA